MTFQRYGTTKRQLVLQRDGRTYYLSPGKRGQKLTAKRQKQKANVLMHSYKSPGNETLVMFEYNGATVTTIAHKPRQPLTLIRDVDETDGTAPSPACLFCLEPAYGNMFRLRSWQDRRYYVTIQGKVAVLRQLGASGVRERDQMFKIW